ncbi:MAG: tRNA pseudouridine(13) synthase TruD [Candidatus Saliniplasma sp.]
MENKVGIETFFTDTPGVGGKIKVYPEDFYVCEEIQLPYLKDGEYTIAKVWSRNWETNRLVLKLAKELGISRDDIAFSGTKDKRAVTIQWMSFKTEPDRVKDIDISDVKINDIRKSHRTLHLGMHKGNDFKIIIRDMRVESEKAVELANRTGGTIIEEGGFPNWFGIQRFGALRPITHEVGRYIVKGDYEKAVKTYIANPIEGENEECKKARSYLERTWDHEGALDIYPQNLHFERSIIKYLKNNPEDYISSLKKLPRNLRMMFVHAYQSYLFNRMVSKRLKEGYPLNDALVGDVLLPADRSGLPNKNTKVEVSEKNIDKASKMVRAGKAYVSGPLIGCHTEFSGGIQGEFEKKLMEEESLEKEDFVIPKLTSLSSTGTRREMFSKVKDLKWNPDRGGLKLEFSLNKGCYATTLLREFMKLPPSQVARYS